MKYALVTGGAGFIGSHVVRHLLRQGKNVLVLDDLSGGFAAHLPEGVVFIQGSITDHHLLEKIFQEYRIEYIYHLAAYAAEGLSHFIKRFNYTNNLTGSVNLINEAVKHEVACFVFTSSIATYGSLPPPMTEDMNPQPEDPYGIAKLAVEMELKATKEMFGLDYVIFRPHNVYGEFQNLGDRYRNVIGIFMNRLMQGLHLPIFGDGAQTRAFTYVGDIAPIIADCVENKGCYGQVFNLGADQQYSLVELADAVMEAMETRVELQHLEARKEVVHAYCDHSKAKAFFDVSETSLSEGLRRMARWAKEAGIRKSSSFDGIEIRKNLPELWSRDVE